MADSIEDEVGETTAFVGDKPYPSYSFHLQKKGKVLVAGYSPDFEMVHATVDMALGTNLLMEQGTMERSPTGLFVPGDIAQLAVVGYKHMDDQGEDHHVSLLKERPESGPLYWFYKFKNEPPLSAIYFMLTSVRTINGDSDSCYKQPSTLRRAIQDVVQPKHNVVKVYVKLLTHVQYSTRLSAKTEEVPEADTSGADNGEDKEQAFKVSPATGSWLLGDMPELSELEARVGGGNGTAGSPRHDSTKAPLSLVGQDNGFHSWLDTIED